MLKNAGARSAKPKRLFAPVVKRLLGQQRAEKLKARWMDMPAECFVTLAFRDLGKGDLFIALPWPGDNDGHGGLMQQHNLFMKVGRRTAIRKRDGVRCKTTTSMEVVLIK